MKQTKTKEERCSYIRGVMEACQAMGVTPDVVASVCLDLYITGKEMHDLREELITDAKVDNHVPKVQG